MPPPAVPTSLLTCRPVDYEVHDTSHFRAYVVVHRPTGEEARVTYADLMARTGITVERLGPAAVGDAALAFLERAVVQLAWEGLLTRYLPTRAEREDFAAQLAYLLGVPRGGFALSPA
jgi:hypothetical protein